MRTKLTEGIKALGVFKAAEINVADIRFDAGLRAACDVNYCGNFGKNYTCPPLVGEIADLIEKMKGYKKALVFQCVYKLEDSFDYEGMQSAKKDFEKKVAAVRDMLLENELVLGAGGCTLCSPCFATLQKPCPTPEKAISSLEAHGIFVADLAEKAGMNYINGKDTVTYFGTVFER